MSKAKHPFQIPEKLFGIIGSPIGHSLSPLLHNWGFSREQLPYTYHRWEIGASDLAAFSLAFRTLPISGASVTIPHKQSIIPYLEGLTDEAAATGAVNTLFWEDGALWGDNTDCRGFATPLHRQGLLPDSALILGAGGAALACIQGLRKAAAVDITISARNLDKARALCRRQALNCLPWEERARGDADLLINATPLGTSGTRQSASPMPPDSLERFGTVYDLVYNPLRTVLLAEAEQAGCKVIGGLSMFVNQGLLQFERWTGRSLPEDESRQVLAAAIGK